MRGIVYVAKLMTKPNGSWAELVTLCISVVHVVPTIHCHCQLNNPALLPAHQKRTMCVRHDTWHGGPPLFAGAMRSWPAMSLWGEAYLTRVAGGTEVTVDVTPNGRGDAVTRVGRWLCVLQVPQKHTRACQLNTREALG